MNNFTFGIDGNNGFGYYETICGGSGAGPTWDGTSGVHTNMTNTRITDPEIMERRYPVILNQFSIREGSGGDDKYIGGCGVIREIQFSIPMVASILSERRAIQPYGMLRGNSGASGINLWLRGDGRIVNIGSKGSVNVQKGDRIQILTPGGGDYGPKIERSEVFKKKCDKNAFFPRANGSIDIIRSLGNQINYIMQCVIDKIIICILIQYCNFLNDR